MRDDLLYYYERELTYLRRMGAEFAEAYPKVAGRLQLEPTKCEDPHVERIIEAFAFLAARVHLKLDDDFPEISDALLNVVYPHYTRPLPSMTLAQFELDPERGKITTGLHIPRESVLSSRPVGGVPCQFRTCFDTTLWPLAVAEARWTTPDRLRPAVRASDAAAAITLDLRCFTDVTFGGIELDSLRMFLNGDASVVYALYEVMANNCVRILVRDPDAGPKGRTVTLPASALQPAGFADEDGLLPFPRRSFVGYRMLQEYFALPEKFLFFDLSGFAELRAAGFGDRAEVIILLSPFERADRRAALEAGVSTDTFRLGCTPAVNLFTHTCDPVHLTHRRPEYLLVPDARRRETVRVYSVGRVRGVTDGSTEPYPIEPFYALRHSQARNAPRAYWHATRRPTAWRGNGASDLYLSFVDLTGAPVRPDADVVTVEITAYNGELPSRLPLRPEEGDFELEGGGPFRRITALVKPTDVVEPPLGRPQIWRLISLLSLNYLSLVEGGADALRELLRLHNTGQSAAAEKQIEGLLSVSSEPVYSRVSSEHGVNFARGRRVNIELDEEQFAGGGAYLFASVLERFLGLYASVNSFSVLAARTRQRKDAMRVWPPRAGWKTLL